MPKAGYPAQQYIAENLKYPAEAVQKKIQGRVLVKFVVAEDGSILNPSIVQGLGSGCDEEALRIVRAMPKWKPGMDNGKPVKVHQRLAVMFSLQVNSPLNDTLVYNYVEQMPRAGYDVTDFLNNNMKYPAEARSNKLSGRVVVRFVVNRDGSISDPKVIRGIGSGCDEEAIRLVKLMPPWNPGRQTGHAVRVLYTFPIVFGLSE